MAAPASSPDFTIVFLKEGRAAGSYAGFRRLLAYKVLKSASVSCKAAGSPFALFVGCQPYMSF